MLGAGAPRAAPRSRPAADDQEPSTRWAASWAARRAMCRRSGHELAGAQLGARPRHPAADAHPVQLLDAPRRGGPGTRRGRPASGGRGPSRPARATRTAVFIPGAGGAGVEHGETQRPVTGVGGARPGLHHRGEQAVRVGEVPPRIAMAPLEVAGGDHVGDPSGRGDAAPPAASGSGGGRGCRSAAARRRATRAAAGRRRGRAPCPGSGRTRSASRPAGRGRGS